jgi:hypothetical protein
MTDNMMNIFVKRMQKISIFNDNEIREVLREVEIVAKHEGRIEGIEFLSKELSRSIKP